MTRTIADQLRAAGWKPDQIARATIDGKPLAEADTPAPKRSDAWPGFRSKWEAQYAMVLGDELARGEIVAWVYEGITLRVTEPVIVEGKRRPGVRYKADFAVWLPGGRLRLIEIKGFARQKDVLRYKFARDKFREIEFQMIRKVKGQWVVVL